MRFLNTAICLLAVTLIGCASTSVTETNNSMVASSSIVASKSDGIKMYFGLSIPTGGLITAQQWQKFESNQLAQAFTGFSVVDAVGYYKGEKEPAKVVTIYNVSKADIESANRLAKEYSRLFNQDSVLIARLNVAQISFVGKE
ncbi:DUF3574 domain-containing protein [Pseudoalteromonas luteoviolacea]|nr:DUF3574 domain-containing protein [Pseudoalteromonas luteoviolacea]